MNKLLFLLPLIGCLMGCGDTPQAVATIIVPRPRVVRNICTNLWAVRCYWIKPFYPSGIDSGYFGKEIEIEWIGSRHSDGEDSSDNAQLGHEYQFTDSLFAVLTYRGFHRRQDIADSIQAIERFAAQRKADSIFKCQHNYQ